MIESIFPTTASAIYTVAGAAVVCAVVVQWLKQHIEDSRLYNAAGLGATFVIVEIAGGAFVAGVAGFWERVYIGFLVALFGASLATFGWEMISNLLGKAGVGPRSDAARDCPAPPGELDQPGARGWRLTS
jgi:asparagine N-glycosylation enzyme membrane subunit Stt3